MLIFGIIMGMIMTLVVYSAYILLIAFTLWMVVDAAKQDRFWWVVLIIGVPFIGSAVYFFTEKKHEYAKAPVRHVHESETEHQHESSPHHTHAHHVHVAESVEVKKEESALQEEIKEEGKM